jgi:glutathione peroxidase
MKKLFSLLAVLLSFLSQTVDAQTEGSAFIFSFTDIHGKLIPLSQFEHKVVMVVNTASQCGFTPQYAQLQILHEQYANKGLVIIAVPSPDFGNQEFSNNNKIEKFTTEKFGATFLLMSPEHVKGNSAHPFYLWANASSGFLGSPKWNFHKCLIGKDGQLIGWFSSPTKPTSKKIITAITKALAT